MIVTIDGYAGSGKSTAARQLAAALGFDLLNTGGMYRAAALALARRGVDIHADPRDAAAIRAHADRFAFDLSSGRVVLDGADLTADLRTEEAAAGASKVGTFPEVRAPLQREQRRLAAGRDIVCEGRDQGTAVFPDAAAKFFLWASPCVRADRRAAELRSAGLPADRAAILSAIAARDAQDEGRAVDPLSAAADAFRIDTTDLAADAVLALMLAHVRRCRAGGPAGAGEGR